MKKSFILIISLIILSAISINAQTNKIKLGNKSLIVKGKLFNEIEYNFSSSKNKYAAYFYIDKAKKALFISEISYEFENGKANAVRIETYTCPLAKINKKDSYNLEMEDEAVPGGKYWRLTLLATGNGVDNMFFTKRTTTTEDTATERVNNVTINILGKAEAEKWLKQFAK